MQRRESDGYRASALCDAHNLDYVDYLQGSVLEDVSTITHEFDVTQAEVEAMARWLQRN